MTAKLQRKRQRSFIYEGFGFPVELRNVPMVRLRGVWTPDINLDWLESALLEALAHKPARLTGVEVRFIRHCFSMTLQQFAERFDVTHPTVMSWERAEADPTSMKWPMEKDLRLEILRRTRPQQTAKFAHEYTALEKARPEQPQPSPLQALVKVGAMLKTTEWRFPAASRK